MNEAHIRPLVARHAVESRHLGVRVSTDQQAQAIGNLQGKTVRPALGIGQSPFEAWLTLRGLKTLELS